MILRSRWGVGGSIDMHTRGGGGGADDSKSHKKFYRTFCAGIFWPMHLLEASFGCMLCTPCIFVMVVERTLAIFFAVFDICGVCTGVYFSNCTACKCGVPIVGFCI